MTSFDAPTIGRRIAKYRRLNGMKAGDLAAAVGEPLSQTAVTKLENGYRVDLSSDLLARIALALGVPPSVLLLPLERLDEIVAGRTTALEALALFQGWEVDARTAAGTEVQAQLSALRVYLQIKTQRDEALYNLAFHSDGAELAARRETLDESQTAIDAQLTVLRRFGIELPLDS